MESQVFDLEKILKGKDEEHAKSMVEVVESAIADYAKLEQEHHNTINKMKDAEERARIEADLKVKFEAKVVELKEKVRLIEAECIQSISLTWEEGKQAGQQELLDQVKTDFQGVFNRGFWDGWKSALKNADVPSSSEMYSQDNTPLPLPDAGLRASDNEDEDEEVEENEQTKEAETEQDLAKDSVPPKATDPPTPAVGS